MFALARKMLALAAILYAVIVADVLIAAVLAFGPVIGLAPLALIAVRAANNKRRHRQLTSGGTAAWADSSELRRAGMLQAKTGLILGRISEAPASGPEEHFRATRALFDTHVDDADACRNLLEPLFGRRHGQTHLVRLPQACHCMTVAPTGVGKGVSIVTPFLLTCEESVVAVDFKGELVHLTSSGRRKMGQRIVILDPFRAATTTPDTLNPLDFISADDPLALDQCRALAEALVIREGGSNENPHWPDSAEAVIAAAIGVVVFYGNPEQGTRSLQAVRDILSDPRRWELAKKLMREHGGMLARWGGQMEHYRGDELSSILSTSNRFLRFLDTPAIAESTTSSSFAPDELTQSGRRSTVYLVLPPEHARTQSALLRVWVGSLFQASLRGGLQETNKVHYVLDESAALGHFQQLDDAVDKYRAYGVRLYFFYQSLGQLKKCWPADEGQTLLSNTSKVFFGINDIQTAEYVSKTLGNETIIVDSGGSNTGTSRQTGTSSGSSHSQSTSTTYSDGTSSNWQQQTRELKKPDELIALPPRLAITLTPGVRPTLTTLVRSYEAPQLFQRGCGEVRPRWDAGRVLLAATLLLAFVAGSAAFFTCGLVVVIREHSRQTPAAYSYRPASPARPQTWPPAKPLRPSPTVARTHPKGR